MTTTNGMMFSLATIALLAGLAVGSDETASGVSEDVSLNTCSFSAVTVEIEQDLDTRSYTDAWSPPRKLSTKKIVGTMIMMR